MMIFWLFGESFFRYTVSTQCFLEVEGNSSSTPTGFQLLGFTSRSVVEAPPMPASNVRNWRNASERRMGKLMANQGGVLPGMLRARSVDLGYYPGWELTYPP